LKFIMLTVLGFDPADRSGDQIRFGADGKVGWRTLAAPGSGFILLATRFPNATCGECPPLFDLGRRGIGALTADHLEPI
jgi:hypothetical protein